jgi:peptide/nickel transport system substrate-binding protein
VTARLRRRPGRASTALFALVVAVALGASAGVAANADETPSSTATTATGTASEPPQTKTTFTIGLTQDIDSTNPFTGIAAASYEIYQLIYDTLNGYSAKDFSTTGILADSWTPAADGLTWTYKIKPNLKWSDGQPLTSADVAYSINRVRNGTYEQTNWGNYVTNITNVTAADPTTVVMTVKKPTPIMYHISVPIIPEHIWSSISEKAVANFANEPSPGKPIVGSGPFVLTQVVKGQFIRLERNPDYWGTPSKIDHLVFRVFNSQDSMAQALKRGEIDFADNVDANIFNSLRNTPGITTADTTYSGFDEIAMNTGAALDDGTPIGDGNPVLKDKVVRQAINYAIDRKTLVQKVFGNYATVGSSIIPPLYASLHYDPGASAYPFDPDKANQLLDQAGYTKGSDGYRKMPGGGKEISLRLFGRSSSETSSRTVPYVSGWLKDIGIKTSVKLVSEDNLTDIIGQGKYDLFEWGWVVEPDPDYQLSTFTCASRSYKDGGSIYANLSDSFYCNKAYDALYEKQAGQVDVAERAATVKQMQQMLYEDAPYAITAYYDNLEAYRSDRWTGFTPQPAPDSAGKGGSLLFQYGTYSYLSMAPASKKSSDSGNQGPGVAIFGGIVGGVALLGLIGWGFSRMRRRPRDEIE